MSEPTKPNPLAFRPPVTHDLKSWPEYFVCIMSGAKTFDVRVNDRDFRAGDILLLREFVPAEKSPGNQAFYTGRQLTRQVSYIMEIDEKRVCMGFWRPDISIDRVKINTDFADDLKAVINKHSMENGSNTPDFFLAGFLNMVLQSAEWLINEREEWFGRIPAGIKSKPPTEPPSMGAQSPVSPTDCCRVQATSVTGAQCWLVEVIPVQSDEGTGPIIRMINNVDKANIFTRAQAEVLLPKVHTTHPDARIVSL